MISCLTNRLQMSELSRTIRQLEQEKSQLEEVLAKFSEQREALESDRNNLDVEKQDLLARIEELENDFEELAEKLEVSVSQEGDWEARYRALQVDAQATQNKITKELVNVKTENDLLKKQVGVLKESTQLGQVQRSLDSLQVVQHEKDVLLHKLQDELDSVLQERDTLSRELLDIESNIEGRVATQIVKERMQVKALENALVLERSEREHDLEHWSIVDRERDSLSKAVDELSNWKAVYEAGHGLQQLARTQKKLSDDNRRLSKALEDQTTRVSQLVDSHSVLSLAFDKLKREVGKPDNFFYDELELHNEVQALHVSLQAQVRELEQQLNNLESENSKLRRSLRENAGSYSADGFKFAGLDADQLIQVNEFAVSLRDGKLQLPLNDRSRELFKEVEKLRNELQKLKLLKVCGSLVS
jgi:chromosome segregation ATPase